MVSKNLPQVNRWLHLFSAGAKILFMTLSINKTACKIPSVNGSELKIWRERLGLSQQELADELKVARNTISRWEVETRKIPEFLDLALETVERNLAKQSRADN